jgi:hypothetical protein
MGLSKVCQNIPVEETTILVVHAFPLPGRLNPKYSGSEIVCG